MLYRGCVQRDTVGRVANLVIALSLCSVRT
jgi:hypothetical protein